MYGMKGTIPAMVNIVDGSGEIKEALGTISWPRSEKNFSQRRRISAVCMVCSNSYHENRWASPVRTPAKTFETKTQKLRRLNRTRYRSLHDVQIETRTWILVLFSRRIHEV